MIDSLESGYGMEELNADRSKPAATADAQASKPDGDFLFGKEGLTFSDVLATVNPLQHLPIISFIYREITGDVIKPIARIAGDALYGGPIGALAGAIDSAAEYAFGGDVGHTMLALVRDGKFPNAHPDAAPTDTLLAQAPQNDAGSSDADYPTRIATAPVAQVAVAPLDDKSGAAPGASAQVAAIPHARLVNRTGTTEALEAQVAAGPSAPKAAEPVEIAELPRTRLVNRTGDAAPASVAPSAPAQIPVAAIQPAPIPSAQAQLAQAPSSSAPINSAAAMTISEAAAADENQSRGAAGALGRGGASFAGFGLRPPASSLAAATVPAPAGGDPSSAVNSLAQLSATGLSRTGLPTAGAATPASVIVQAQNAAAPGGDPSQAFGTPNLRPPHINNIAPRMPVTYQAQNHTAVALPSRSAGAPRPLQAPMGPVEATAGSDQPVAQTASVATPAAEQAAPAPIAPAAVPDTMARALDKYEAMMKSRRGDSVNQSY